MAMREEPRAGPRPGTFWLILLFCVVAVAFQSEVSPSLKLWGAHPEVALTFALCTGVYLGIWWGTGIGLACGFLESSLELTSPGATVLSRALGGMLAGILGERVYKEVPLVAGFVAFVCTWASEAAFGVISPTMPFPLWLKITLLESVYNSVLAPFLYRFLWLACGPPP